MSAFGVAFTWLVLTAVAFMAFSAAAVASNHSDLEADADFAAKPEPGEALQGALTERRPRAPWVRRRGRSGPPAPRLLAMTHRPFPGPSGEWQHGARDAFARAASFSSVFTQASSDRPGIARLP